MPNFFRNVLVPAPVTWRFKYLEVGEYEKVLGRAGWLYGFDPDEADARLAMSELSVPVKLVYSEDDAIAPPSFGKELSCAAKHRCELKTLPAADDEPSIRAHLRLIRDEQAGVSGEVIELIAAIWR